MGTHYDIKIAHSPLTRLEARRLLLDVEQYLRQFNDEMSTYIADSEISRFNRARHTDPVPVSVTFATVTREALQWAERTNGAFDPTLDPLINLWGFGHETAPTTLQTDEAIDAILSHIGYRHLSVPDYFHIQKDHPDIQLNLNAIAKGHAIDGVAQLIRLAGATNLYVEIGGDLVVYGFNRENAPWRIGIEEPDPDAAPGEKIHGIAHMSHGALAGSGDYRQFHTVDEGRVLSHIIDPRTGRPVAHTLASVNVWADTCSTADAVATALIVMGSEEGLAWIERTPEVEAVFFERDHAGHFRAVYSSGFEEATGFRPR